MLNARRIRPRAFFFALTGSSNDWTQTLLAAAGRVAAYEAGLRAQAAQRRAQGGEI